MTEKLERITELTPAFDRRDPDPKKNYGIHGVELRMILKGERGAVQFVLYTNWQLPHVQKESEEKWLRKDDLQNVIFLSKPLPADIGYHSPFPQYEGHEAMGSVKREFVEGQDTEIGEGVYVPTIDAWPTGTFDPCPYLDGRPCYYDGSGLQAEKVYKILLTKGSEGVWEELERRYQEQFATGFEGEKSPILLPAATEENK